MPIPTPNKRTKRPRGSDKYVPPDNVDIVSLGTLLDGRRTVLPDQQGRLGIEEGLNLKLWSAGDMALVQRPCVAVVGTRQVSPYGAARARRLSRELAAAGVVVVSGLARGVDTEALTAAIKAGGKVIAIIGTPIDRAYPAENKKLQEQIYREHLLISQFPPKSRVFPSNFPARNKLMAAISDGTAIVEAGQSSGTLHQAAECVRLGRWLFIARSTVDNSSVHWPQEFIGRPKVRILSSTQDILEVILRAAHS